MTTNHCLDILRRRKILSFMGFENAPEVEDKKDSEKAIDLGFSPVIVKALEKLPEKQKACLLMREMEDLSYEDIAAALQLSLGTVKSNIHRAKAFLKESLEKEGLTPDDV
jgi:RNA polymerase sigma factor (sigma-70 family)